jgi:hypothetical protein
MDSFLFSSIVHRTTTVSTVIHSVNRMLKSTNAIGQQVKNYVEMVTLVMIVSAVRISSFLLDTYCLSRSFSDIRPCEGQPCMNNGTCVVYLQSYRCQCQRGFTGQSCETSKITYFRLSSMDSILFY